MSLHQGFEGITAGTPITAGNSGTSGQTPVTPVLLNGTMNATATSPIYGTRSALCHRTGTGYAYGQIGLSGETKLTQRARFRVQAPTIAESWMIQRNAASTAVAQAQMATNRKVNLVTTGFGTRYTLPTALTAGTDYDLFLSSDAGSTSTDGKVAFWVRDTSGNLAGGMTAAVEYTGINQGAGSTFALAQAGLCSSNASTTDLMFDEWTVYPGLYAVGDLNPLAVPMASTLNAEPGTIVDLFGDDSVDPDGTVSGWTWTAENAAAAAVTIVGSGANRTILAPAVLVDTDLTFGLVVTGTSGTSTKALVTFTVMAATDKWKNAGGIYVPALMKF